MFSTLFVAFLWIQILSDVQTKIETVCQYREELERDVLISKTAKNENNWRYDESGKDRENMARNFV